MKIYDEIEKIARLISDYPKLYPEVDNKKKLRKAVILKNTILLYYFNGKSIEIRNVIDSRSNY